MFKFFPEGGNVEYKGKVGTIVRTEIDPDGNYGIHTVVFNDHCEPVEEVTDSELKIIPDKPED
jgi:hypothetical protein